MAHRHITRSGNRTSCYFFPLNEMTEKWQNFDRLLCCSSEDTPLKAISVVLAGSMESWCSDFPICWHLTSNSLLHLLPLQICFHFNIWYVTRHKHWSTDPCPSTVSGYIDCELCGVNSAWLRTTIHAEMSDVSSSSHVIRWPKLLHPSVRFCRLKKLLEGVETKECLQET